MMKYLVGAAMIGSLALSTPALASPPMTEITNTVTGIGDITNSWANNLGFGSDSAYHASSMLDARKCQPTARCFLLTSILESATPASFSDIKERLKAGDKIDYALIDGRSETIKRVYLDVHEKDSDTSVVFYVNPENFPAGDAMTFLAQNSIPNKATKQFHNPTAAEYVGYGVLKMVIYTIL